MSKFLRPSGVSEIKIPKLGRLNCETATGLWYFDHFTETEHPPAVYKKFVEEAKNEFGYEIRTFVKVMKSYLKM